MEYKEVIAKCVRWSHRIGIHRNRLFKLMYYLYDIEYIEIYCKESRRAYSKIPHFVDFLENGAEPSTLVGLPIQSPRY